MSTQLDTATTVDDNTTTTTTTTATTIARLCLHDPTHFQTQYSQILHRLNLVQHWKAAAAAAALSPGSNVLELGCGQGDCTVTLAYTVARGELGGRVVAIDPAELNYGKE